MPPSGELFVWVRIFERREGIDSHRRRYDYHRLRAGRRCGAKPERVVVGGGEIRSASVGSRQGGAGYNFERIVFVRAPGVLLELRFQKVLLRNNRLMHMLPGS